MIDESIQDINKEELEDSENALIESFGENVVKKFDQLLDYRIIGAEGGVESKEKQRVIVYYKPKKEFDDLLEEFEGELEKHRPEAQDESYNKSESENHLEEEFKFIEDFFEENAKALEKNLEEIGGEVLEHLALGNAVVSLLTPAQMKEIAKRDDVEWLEAEKFMSLELDESSKTVGVFNAREDRLAGTGKGIAVAVIDGEVDADHPDLKGRVKLKRNYTSESWGKPHRHGTHVAGIIAGDGKQYQGMAPDAEIWSYKIYPSEQTESAEGSKSADAIEDAVKDGAKVINCSWGVSQVTLDGTSIWARTAERAAKLGVVLVKSAGNKGPEQGTITSPADAMGDVIVVGASSHKGDSVMDFSSRGPTADNRQRPDIIAPGDKINAAKVGGDYIRLSGTSMASPHIAGIAALMLERNPKLKPWQIKKILMESAKPVSSEYDPNTQGKGLVDVIKAFEAIKTAGQQVPDEKKITCTAVKEKQLLREKLNITLKNTSGEVMREVKAILESNIPEIKVVSKEGNYKTLLIGAEDNVIYEIEVGPDIKIGTHELDLNVSYTAPSGSKSITCKVNYEVGKQQKSAECCAK